MHILKERFRRIEVTENGPGKLLFVIMVSTAFLISGMVEVLSETTYELSHPVPKNNHSNSDQGRRYCDPPNMTTVYLDFSEEIHDEYAGSHNQDTIIENSISRVDVEKYKDRIFLGWAVTLSFLPACFFTSKYGSSNVFSVSFLLPSITLLLYNFRLGLRLVQEIYISVLSGFSLLSFYQMAYSFAPSCRNSLISIASLKFVGLAIGELLISLGSTKLNYACNTLAVVTVIWFCIWWKIQFTSPRNQVFYKYQKTTSISKTPWKNALRSRPVWMTIAVIFGASCGASCILNAMRLYLENVYSLQVKTIYAVSSLLHFGFAISCGFFVHYLIKARIVSVTSSRRMIVYLSHFIPAGLLFVIGFVGCGLITPIVLYCLSIMMTGANYTGAFSSPLDLAPKYSGPIMALCFSFGTLGRVVMDHLILYILTNQVFVSWRFIFSLNSLILFLTAIFFMLRGSGSVQEWNDPDNPPKERINKCAAQQGSPTPAAPVPKQRTKSIYMVEKKILKVLHVQEPDKFTRVRAYSTSLPNERSNVNPPNIYRPSNKKRASIS